MMHGSAPRARVFIHEPSDGFGHRVEKIIRGMGNAAKLGVNFGGAIASKTNPKNCHMKNCTQLICDFFGLQRPEEILIYGTPPVIDAQFSWDMRDLSSNTSLILASRSDRKSRLQVRSGTTSILMDGFEHRGHVGMMTPLGQAMSPELASVLRSTMRFRPLKFAANRPTVALHLRRGDVDCAKEGFGGNAPRSKNFLKKELMANNVELCNVYQPDDYYFSLVEQIRRHLPTADVHVWSSTENNYVDSDFQGYRDRGMTVHLDDEDLMDPMTHFIKANVFLVSPSHFSYAAAVLNPNCVIYPNTTAEFLAGPSWFEGTRSDRSSYAAQLQACLAHGMGQ